MLDVQARPAGLVISLVDDDAGIRESLRFLLEEENYEVEELADGATALARLDADSRPRVMLLDRMMPRLSGVQTLRALAARPEFTRRTAILFMSARHDPPEPQDEAFIRDAAFATVIKPFDLDKLLDAIQRAAGALAQRLTAE